MFGDAINVECGRNRALNLDVLRLENPLSGCRTGIQKLFGDMTSPICTFPEKNTSETELFYGLP